jgi:cob(I)alamin adenosyltransferase
MKLYTKTGDKGMTSLVGGTKVRKDSERLCAYGTLDELNSLVGYIVSQSNEFLSIHNELIKIQNYLFDCGSDLATPYTPIEYKISKSNVNWLELKIDEYSEIPPKIEQFIIPGGTPLASLFHMARTVTRRAEREIVTLQATVEINDEVLIFVNRLSDYFFALARVVNFNSGNVDVFIS